MKKRIFCITFALIFALLLIPAISVSAQPPPGGMLEAQLQAANRQQEAARAQQRRDAARIISIFLMVGGGWFLYSIIVAANNASNKPSNIEKPMNTYIQPSAEGQGAPTLMDALTKRAFMCLEDGDWDKADGLFEQALNENPENSYAYIGKLCVELRLKREKDLSDYELPIDDYSNYKRALQFADEKYKGVLKMYAILPGDKEEAYQNILIRVEEVKASRDHKKLAGIKSELTEFGDYKDAQQILKTLGNVSVNTVISCKNCARKNASIRTTCLDCGAELD